MKKLHKFYVRVSVAFYICVSFVCVNFYVPVLVGQPVDIKQVEQDVARWLGTPVRLLRILSGGLTNTSFVTINTGDQCMTRSGLQDLSDNYVVRLGKPDPEILGISREREAAWQEAASQVGIAPKVLYSNIQDGTLISGFINGKTLTVRDVCDKAQLPRIVTLIKKCHQIPFKKEFKTCSIYDNIHTMMSRSLACKKPFITEQEVAYIKDILNKIEAHFVDKEERYAGLCHCDLLPGNIMDDGAQLWLIDWEYASWGNILFDLASLSIEAQFNEAQIKKMLELYFGKSWQDNYYDFQLVCILFNLRNAFWYDLRGQDLEAIGEVKMADYARRHLDLFKKESENVMKTQVYKEIEKILPSQFTKIEGDTCTVWEYDENKIAGFSCSIVNGRYPEVGQVMNTACDLIYFVLSGTGAITYAGNTSELKKGESFFIGKNKEYFILGQDLFFAMVELPKWTLEQYKKID